jgi:hypothetical protein
MHRIGTLGLKHSVTFGRGLRTEQGLDLLQTQPFRLRNAEVDERYRQGNETREYEVGPVSVQKCVSKLNSRYPRELRSPNVRHHVRHRPSNDKVEQPVRRSAHRHADTSHPETEDLRANDPWQAGVREAEAHGEDVDESDSGIASSCQFTTFTFARTCDFDVCSDEPLQRSSARV